MNIIGPHRLTGMFARSWSTARRDRAVLTYTEQGLMPS